MPRLVLIRGVPGTGKTTLAKQYALRGYVHCENDQYFDEYGRPACFSCRDWDKSKEFCFRKVTKAMQQGRDVVVANTFTQKWQMDSYKYLAWKYWYTVEVIVLTHEYGSVHNVPAAEMERIRGLWED